MVHIHEPYLSVSTCACKFDIQLPLSILYLSGSIQSLFRNLFHNLDTLLKCLKISDKVLSPLTSAL